MELQRGRLLTDEEVLVLVVVRHEFLLLHTKLLKYTNYSGHEDTCAHTPKLPIQLSQHPPPPGTSAWMSFHPALGAEGAAQYLAHTQRPAQEALPLHRAQAA